VQLACSGVEPGVGAGGTKLTAVLLQEIESWVEALQYYDNQDYEKALEIFEQNADTSKIYFNIGMIHATLGEHERAVSCRSYLHHAYSSPTSPQKHAKAPWCSELPVTRVWCVGAHE
jgi:hypothetical protein